MKRAALGALAALWIAACAPPDPAVVAEHRWRVCETGIDAYERSFACSDVIQSDAPAERRAQALVHRATVAVDSGQHMRALADLGRALRLQPNNAQALMQRGALHHDRAAFGQAIADYDAALRIDPTLELAATRRQDAIALRIESYEALIAQFNTEIDRNPNDADLWNGRCWRRATEGRDLDLALYDCNEALRLNPGHNEALDSRGLVHIKRGDFAAGLRDYDAALAINPGRGHYLYGRGLCRIGLGMTAEGEADLAAAERAEPGVTELYRGYNVAPMLTPVQAPASPSAQIKSPAAP
jgi:tetratricopeptide (TPR) repeat protein